MRHWDPIGVAGLPDAADEYDAYLPRISAELRTGSVASLGAYLHEVSTEHMGLARGVSDDQRAAEALFDWASA